MRLLQPSTLEYKYDQKYSFFLTLFEKDDQVDFSILRVQSHNESFGDKFIRLNFVT